MSLITLMAFNADHEHIGVIGQSRARDDLVRDTMQRAGLSRDLRDYTGAERDRAASETAARLDGSRLRRYIMGDGENGGS
jgi:hypothetical protein